jgi:hypothetical protein
MLNLEVDSERGVGIKCHAFMSAETMPEVWKDKTEEKRASSAITQPRIERDFPAYCISHWALYTDAAGARHAPSGG